MKTKISFTVFIPCFGSCVYLRETLDSLVNQNYKIEIIVCPQGDTDITDILRDYPMVKSIPFAKPSSYKSRIFLFNKSKSDYIYYADDDDILPEGLFDYVNNIIHLTGFLDLYRIPLKEFKNNEYDPSLKKQSYNYLYTIEGKDAFLKKCLNGTYHNGIVHLFIRNKLNPKWFDVDAFQTEDRLLTYSIAKSITTDVCIINDAFYLYRKYNDSHSRTLDFLKARDDFITVNDCLFEFMSNKDIIYYATPIILRIISYLKNLNIERRFSRQNFLKIYSNENIWKYLQIFVEEKKNYRAFAGDFVYRITRLINKKRYNRVRFLIKFKCFYELRKYGKVQF